MNDIDLINRFWDLERRYKFSCTETALFFYLIYAVKQGEEINTYNCKMVELAKRLKIGLKELKMATLRLVEVGVISFEVCDKWKAVYCLKY